MRVILDTNTLISAIFWDKLPDVAYSAAFDGKYILIATADLLAEFERVLIRPKFAAALTALNRTAADILDEHRQLAELVSPAQIPNDAVRDSKDIPILACAVGGKADYIVTGDKDLLVLGVYGSIRIVTVGQFIEILQNVDDVGS